MKKKQLKQLAWDHTEINGKAQTWTFWDLISEHALSSLAISENQSNSLRKQVNVIDIKDMQLFSSKITSKTQMCLQEN